MTSQILCIDRICFCSWLAWQRFDGLDWPHFLVCILRWDPGALFTSGHTELLHIEAQKFPETRGHEPRFTRTLQVLFALQLLMSSRTKQVTWSVSQSDGRSYPRAWLKV